jgi:hypothetical protein
MTSLVSTRNSPPNPEGRNLVRADHPAHVVGLDPKQAGQLVRPPETRKRQRPDRIGKYVVAHGGSLGIVLTETATAM